MLKRKLCFFLFLPHCLFHWVIFSSVISIQFSLSDHTTLQKRHIITSNEEVAFFGLFLLAFQFVHMITGKLVTLWHILQCFHAKTRSISHPEHQKWVQHSRPMKGTTKAWVYANVLYNLKSPLQKSTYFKWEPGAYENICNIWAHCGYVITFAYERKTFEGKLIPQELG